MSPIASPVSLHLPEAPSATAEISLQPNPNHLLSSVTSKTLLKRGRDRIYGLVSDCFRLSLFSFRYPERA